MIHFYFFLVGAIIASFLGLVIDRFPEQSIIVVATVTQAIPFGMLSLSLDWGFSF